MRCILGQPRAVATLSTCVRTGRMHHAWIFAGPRGVGKFTTAMELAKVLLADHHEMDERGVAYADDADETARRVASGSHPDLHVIRKELAKVSRITELRSRKQLNIAIGLLREFMIGGQLTDSTFVDGPISLRPMMSRSKVFIIDEAELLDDNGQNALLKTLEEPPPRTYIILVTSRAYRLLPTIISRCQYVSFKPLDDDSINRWLDEQSWTISGKDRDWLVRYCGGSIGDLERALKFDISEWRNQLEPLVKQLSQGQFPFAMGKTMSDLINAYAAKWEKQHENASIDAAKKDAASLLIQYLADCVLRDLRRAKSHSEAHRCLGVIDMLREFEEQYGRHVNLKLALENLVVQWRAAIVQPMPAGGVV